MKRRTMPIAGFHDQLQEMPSRSTTRGEFMARALTTLLLIFGVHAIAWCGNPSTIEDYRSRLGAAIKELKDVGVSDDYDTEQSYSDTMQQALLQVRSDLPDHETVRTGDGIVEVDNSWISPPIAYLSQTDITTASREKMVATILERLESIKDATTVVNAARTDSGGKDQDKAKLAEIKRRSEFSNVGKEDPIWKRYWQRFKNWLNNLFASQAPAAVNQIPTASRYARYLLYLIILVAALFIVWKLLPFWGIFTKRDKLSIAGDRTILGEKLGAGQTPADLLRDAEALAQSGEIRAAIRKTYVAMLLELGNRKLLKIEDYKTNRDYLQNIQKRESLYGEMRALTGRFERHWYGLLPANESDWTEFRGKYDLALEIATKESDKKKFRPASTIGSSS